MILRHNIIHSSVLLVIGFLLLLATSVCADPAISHDLRHIYTVGSSADLQARAKRPSYVSHVSSDLTCRPFGECEPCPQDELDQPFCLPFGNRRLLHCVLAAAADTKAGGSGGSGGQSGEVPAWEACGKVIKKERQDFWEFVTANLLFLLIALTVLWARTSALATEQYRQLAARIGQDEA